VVVPYVALHPLAAPAIRDFLPAAELAYVGADDLAYWRLLRGLWRDGETFLIVEQDIEVHDQVVPSLQDCDHDWCIFPYPGPMHMRGWSQEDNSHFLVRSLGCTRFSDRLLATYPTLVARLTKRTWESLDLHIYEALARHRLTPHPHAPPVLQHHVYEGWCACGMGHEPYPVDVEGRYADA
jgi:hypothetical protein